MQRRPSKSDRLFDTIIDWISVGTYEPGAKLPSIARLAEMFEVSTTTVTNVEALLHRTGWIESQPGAGVYVARKPPVGSLPPET